MMLPISVLIMILCLGFSDQIKYSILKYHGCEEWQGYRLYLFPASPPEWYKSNPKDLGNPDILKLCDIPIKCWTRIHFFNLNQWDDASYFKNIVIDTMGEETAERLTGCKRSD